MAQMDDTTAPLFRQIANLLEDAIVESELRSGDRAPSTNELARFHRINPATARKGIGLLVERGILVKKRGVGMFVTEAAEKIIREQRRSALAADYLAPLVDEAMKLGMTRNGLHDLMERVSESRGLYQ